MNAPPLTVSLNLKRFRVQCVVDRGGQVQFRPQVALRGLYRGVPEQELDLFQIPARLAAHLAEGIIFLQVKE